MEMDRGYGVAQRNVLISYDVVGSGEGVRRFIANAVDLPAAMKS